MLCGVDRGWGDHRNSLVVDSPHHSSSLSFTLDVVGAVDQGHVRLGTICTVPGGTCAVTGGDGCVHRNVLKMHRPRAPLTSSHHIELFCSAHR